MKRLGHLSPRYIFDRLNQKIYEKKYPDNPWLTKQSISLLDKILTSQDMGVEFGSGRSTKWFLKKLSHLISIESNKDWYNKVSFECDVEIKKQHLDYRFAETEQEYKAIINGFENASIDFTLVDGRYRDLCANMMVDKIKVGGLIVIDNVNWFIPNDATRSPDSQRSIDGCSSEAWKNFLDAVDGWRMIWTSNGVSDTAIWIRK